MFEREVLDQMNREQQAAARRRALQAQLDSLPPDERAELVRRRRRALLQFWIGFALLVFGVISMFVATPDMIASSPGMVVVPSYEWAFAMLEIAAGGLFMATAGRSG